MMSRYSIHSEFFGEPKNKFPSMDLYNRCYTEKPFKIQDLTDSLSTWLVNCNAKNDGFDFFKDCVHLNSFHTFIGVFK